MKLNKMFKQASLATLLFFSGAAFANPIVVLSESASDYTQTESGYILNFKLDATSAELAELQSKIAGQSDRITMNATLTSEGHYNVVYTVDHQNQPEYVYKMMLVSGFSTLKYQGGEFGLEKIVDVLYSYQQ